jgi:hypothetical protein
MVRMLQLSSGLAMCGANGAYVAQCQTSKEDANRALVGASITFSIPSGTEV